MGSAAKLHSREAGSSVLQERAADKKRKNHHDSVASAQIAVCKLESGLVCLFISVEKLVSATDGDSTVMKITNQVAALVLCSQQHNKTSTFAGK